ncbi:hypothetical protein B7463_g8068, partial [Scytalidium lignicola]
MASWTMAAISGGTVQYGFKRMDIDSLIKRLRSITPPGKTTENLYSSDMSVPIYSIASWSSIISLKFAMFVDPIRDIYEAFTIYTFFQLLINFIGGERALIIMMHGRKPVSHLWPLNHFLPKVDLSDPHTFLAVKRGILQYAWLKPILALASIIMKSTGVYQEGYIGLSSGYFWSGIIYNISVTVSLYSLGLFWVCMSKDLQPFRPVPKFLSVKLIIFASYWQGFFLSILVWLGAIPDNVQGYTPDNLAAAIQDTLICLEMPLFAIAHWSAFSWHDYADSSISAARMPVWYALRDAFGIRDLIEDTKETFMGNTYKYRLFDTGDNILAHESSSSRVSRMMEGMRYERGGRGKYWIPKPGEATVRTPLLSGDHTYFQPPADVHEDSSPDTEYGTGVLDTDALDPEEERLYAKAREQEFGDWNYPVVATQEGSRERWLITHQSLLMSSANPKPPRHMRNSEVHPANNTREHDEEILPRKAQRKSSKGKTKSASVYSEGQVPQLKDTPREYPISNLNDSESRHVVNNAERHAIDEGRQRVHTGNEVGVDGSEKRRSHVQPYREDMDEGSSKGSEIAAEEIGAGQPNVDEFIVGEEESDESARVDSNESREWNSVREDVDRLKPNYGLEGEEFENVWRGGPS